MFLTFKSIDNEGNEIKFQTEYEKLDNKYIFDDLSVENTKVELMMNEENVIINRFGDTESKFVFIQGINTLAFYKNSLGLELKMNIFTKKIIIKSKQLYLEYELILDSDVISSHKIWILFH